MTDRPPLLAGVRVIESSLLGPGLIATFLADLGADVIKVEPPQGDYIRQMTWPIVDGVSLLHLHTHRGKRSITLDLRTEEGVEVYKDLVRGADAVVEAMRPGALASEIRQQLLSTVTATPSLQGKTVTGGRLDMGSWGVPPTREALS